MTPLATLQNARQQVSQFEVKVEKMEKHRTVLRHRTMETE
jgi:hypothetical protein